MSKALTFSLLILLTLIINILQATLLAPSNNNPYFPDLNLIFILYLSISRNVPYSIILVILNGFIMDAMSGYMIGLNTLSRLSLYIILKSSSDHFNFYNIIPRLTALFFGTIYVWLFVWIVIALKSSNDFMISLNIIIVHAAVNTVVGLLLIILADKINAKLQK